MSDILADSPTRADFDNIPGAEGVPGVVDKEGGMAVEILCESSRLAFALPFISAAPAVSFVSSRLCLSRLEAHVEVAHLDTPGISNIYGRGDDQRTLRTFLFHFCVPMRTFTVFCMRPAEVTTALIARVDV